MPFKKGHKSRPKKLNIQVELQDFAALLGMCVETQNIASLPIFTQLL